MKAFDIEVESLEAIVHLYGDPEFAALLWKEVEEDFEADESEDVVRLHFVRGDKFRIEWLGMELVDGEVINYIELTQAFGSLDLDKTRVKYKGWLPSSKLGLREGTQDGLRISRNLKKEKPKF